MTDRVTFHSSSSNADAQIGYSWSMRNGEKPWKPCPPKRRITLTGADRGGPMPPTANKKNLPNPKAPDPTAGPSLVSIVPIDISGRLRSQIPTRTENDRKMTESENPRSTLTSSSLPRESAQLTSGGLFFGREHGFSLRRNLDLRGKNPSRDRWTSALSSGSNLDHYLYEDDFLPKVTSKSSNQKPEVSAKTPRPSTASFLLCSSRKSLRTSLRKDDLEPFRRSSTETQMTLSPRSSGSSDVPSKRQKIASTKANRDSETGRRKENSASGKTEPSVFTSGFFTPIDLDDSSRSIVSEDRDFFSSVATLSGQHTFRTVARGARKPRPVPTPRLSGPEAPMDITSRPSNSKHLENPATDSKYPLPVDCSSIEVPVENPDQRCHFQVISETYRDKRPKFCPTSEISIHRSTYERKAEEKGTSAGDSRDDSKTGNQPLHFPPELEQKSFSVKMNSGELESSFLLENSFRIQNSSDKSRISLIQFDAMDPLLTSERHRDPSSSSFGHQDTSSLRSSTTTSDWFSARDGMSSSICVDSINSEPVDFDCESEKTSTPWLSKLKKLFGTVWSILVPGSSSSTKQDPLPVDTDTLSDVDSGCSVGADHEITLNQYPSEMSELQKLAALADRIAMDRKRKTGFLDISCDHRPSSVSSFETGLIPTSASRAGSPRDLESICEVVEESFYHPKKRQRSSPSLPLGLVIDGGGGRRRDELVNSPAVNNSSTDAGYAISTFDSSCKSLPRNGGNNFSNYPLVERAKVNDDCGKKMEKMETDNSNISGKDVRFQRNSGELENFPGQNRPNGQHYSSPKFEISRESSGGRSVLEEESFSMYDQLLLSPDFSISPELEKAIEMLTVASGSLDLGSDPKSPSFRTSAGAKVKSKVACLSSDQHTFSLCEPHHNTDGNMENSFNMERSIKDMVCESGKHGNSLPDRSQTDDTYCLTTDGFTIKIYPATNSSLVENLVSSPRSSSAQPNPNSGVRHPGVGEASPAKRLHLSSPAKAITQNCGSQIPRMKPSPTSGVGTFKDKEKEVSRSKNLVLNPAQSSLSNLRTNSTSPEHQSSRNPVQHTPLLGRIRDGFPSPTVQRTRASKIAFFTGQTVN